MGRIFDELKVWSERLYAIFDSGSRNSYIRESAASSGRVVALDHPFRAALGGHRHAARKLCVLQGSIRGKSVTLGAYVLPDIGDDGGGRPIDLRFGANAMQDFGIRLDPEREQLDLSHYHRELIEL